MEADNKSAVTTESSQEVGLLDVNKSGEAQLLSDGQNELQGAVIIYDNESQEGQVVKLITNIKSEEQSGDQNPDPDNVITLHAPSNDSKDETIEESIVALPSQETTIKTENVSQPEQQDADADANANADADANAVTHADADADTDDDETIATFITSTGQQLALYAVEDSDEIFAVALYDESGEPPTNFHFLMKSDVERLIGEGAVKTVKKPQANKLGKPSQKKDEAIKFERVSQPITIQATANQAITLQVTGNQATENQTTTTHIAVTEENVAQATATESITTQAAATEATAVQATVPEVTATQVVKKEDILEKSMEAIKAEIVEVPKPQPKVQVMVQKKETPKKIITKNHNINNRTIGQTKQIVHQVRPVITQPRQIFVQSRQIVTQPRPVAPQTRQIFTQARQIVTQGRQTVVPAQRQNIISQQRQFVAQTRPLVTQPRQIVTQMKQIIAPARQYVNQTKQYVNQAKPLIYQAKPQTQQIRSAITPLKKPVVNQKEKITYVFQNQDESYVLDLDSDAEILEQSTVQYILCDENPSDSELTFDEVQASLQTFKTGKSTTTTVEPPKPKKETIAKFAPTIRSTPKPATILTPKKQPVTQVFRTYKSPKKARMTNNLLQAQRKIKQEVVDSSYGDMDDGHMSDDPSQSTQNSTLDSSSGVKAKRSRKQQLTVVNRGDSEIIIQPASAYSEEEEEPVVQKRRGRRKKKATPDPDYNPRQPAKRGRRSARLVEVIDIDVDESERSNVLEITLDGKKGSSDKENDVISVGDTDEEDDSSQRKKKFRKPMMQCSHCMRNFRKRRALERHVQICPKSPAYLEKLEERKKLGIEKKFKCKSCDEYFDIAVALARHVRVVHSPRKRGRPPKGWAREEKSESEETDESVDESSPEREVGPKRRGRPPRKRSFSKEVEKSPTGEGESKSGTLGESQPQSTSSEPRRRGRPPGKRSFYVRRSVTPEPEEKSASSDEKKQEENETDEKKPEEKETDEKKLEEKKKEMASPEPRKRGRPPKRSISQEEESEEIDVKAEKKTEGKAEEKTEETFESITVPKKRGRPKKKSVSKDEEIDTVEAEEKTESSAETLSTEPKKRGRPPKRTFSKDEDLADDTKSTESEDKPEEEPAKKQKLSEDESEKKSEEPRRRGRPPKDKPVAVKEEKATESSEADTEPEEPRKRGRPAKSSEAESSKKIKTEMDDMEEVVLSSSQTGKLKKLNCSECGKWFSSVNALGSHQLQHRTKKSGILVNRCAYCKKLVPIESYAKHLAMVHGKSMPSTSTAKPGGPTPAITPEVQTADKTVKVVQRSLRSSN